VRLLPFGLVGAFAALVHYSVAIASVALLHFHPQVGNVCGYLVALVVSYLGQSRFTFPDAERRSNNFLRFTITSLSAFLLNALAYAALLRWTSLDYRIALFLVLLGVAAFTFLVLNKWVFPRGNYRRDD
jgi:putative flippase GtrA